MDSFRADLHCHSTCSDGSKTPSELVALAKTKGLGGLSITDHDTIAGCFQAAEAAKEADISFVSGVEFSTSHQGKGVDVLAYSFAIASPLIAQFCRRHQERRTIRFKKILALLSSLGIELEHALNSVVSSPQHSLGRPHIAAAMVKMGYVQTIRQAFAEFLGERGRCFVPRESFSVEETLHVIHAANGFAVIAHPHLIGDTRTVRDLLEMPFDGIEGYYARYPLREQQRWVKIGMHQGWIVTGGSDYHGAMKPESILGSSWVEKETFNLLHKRFLANELDDELSKTP